jgi:hypothetical protein
MSEDDSTPLKPGRLRRPDGTAIAPPGLSADLERLHCRLDQLTLSAMDNQVLAGTILRLLGRKHEFSAYTRRLFCEIAADESFGGLCPHCRHRPVLAIDPLTGRPDPTRKLAQAEFDHFFHPVLSRAEHGWLICQPCNRDFAYGGALARQAARSTSFARFQALVREWRMRRLAEMRERLKARQAARSGP